ncbi:MAG: hypothetical protein V3T81_01965, partial [Thermoanaerobaculia bacterium]
MKRWSCISLVVPALLAATLAGAPVSAQRLDGQTIREIEFLGLQTLAAETLEFYLGVKVGESFKSEELNEKIHKLWMTHLIDDITVDAQEVDGGVRLVVTVMERPTLRSIEYQ